MKKLLKWSSVAVIALIIGLGIAWIGVKTQSKTTLTPVSTMPSQGHHMPSLTLTEYPDNKIIRTSNFVGKPVFINFWASWCPPCKQETPDIVKAYKKYGDKIIFLSVNATSQDNIVDMENFVKAYGITWPVAMDEKGIAMNTYRIIGLPTSFFVNRQGIITYMQVGLIPGQSLNTHLQEILKK